MTLQITSPRTSSVSFPVRHRVHWLDLTLSIGTTGLLAIGAVVIMAPVAWMLSTSLKTAADAFLFPPIWIPHPLHWENFYLAHFTVAPFAVFYRNTVMYVILSVVGTLVSCSLVAYGFARLRAPGRNFLFILMLSTMMVPSEVTLIPTYILFRKLDWIGTYLPLIVPTYFGSAFNIFLLRQFFMGVPRDYDESARIDGATRLEVLLNIILPLSKPALVTVAIFTFLGRWNDFLGPLIYLTDTESYPVSIGLTYFESVAQPTGMLQQWNLLMAATLVAALPPVLVFFFLQRYFIQGVVVTGLKG
jgi:multiple sugar transport system permease protein